MIHSDPPPLPVIHIQIISLQIPFAISNAVIEGSVQEQDKYNPIPGHSDGTESKDLKPLIQNGQKAYGSFKEVGSNGVANGHQGIQITLLHI